MREDVDHLIETLETAADRLDRMLQVQAEGLRWSKDKWVAVTTEVRGLIEQASEEAFNVALVTDAGKSQ